ncbi:hypothetical protein HZC07_03380 [Candidatus Micrarchaeota archaeon]|nr:hypothetical protein [Candidatus Micrarchaeota archaeon]
MPTWIKDVHRVKTERRQFELANVGKPELLAKQTSTLRTFQAYAPAVVKLAARTSIAFAIYEAQSRTIGVDAADYKLTFDAQKAWSNASSYSIGVARFLTGLVPPTWKETVSHYIIPVEVAISAFRMYVEQKVWKRLQITPDRVGPLATPYLAGLGELLYKATVTYPADAESRLVVGFTGIWGNCVRLFSAAALYGVGTKVGEPVYTKAVAPASEFLFDNAISISIRVADACKAFWASIRGPSS